MPGRNLRRAAAFLSVGLRNYDGVPKENSFFSQIRRAYFSSLRSASGKHDAVEDGAEIRIRYKIGKGMFHWLKTSGKRVLQKAYPEKGGYFIVTWNENGEIAAKSVFSGAHVWLRTSYYCGAVKTPAALVQPGESGKLVLIERDGERGKYVRTELEPCPYLAGTAQQSFVDGAAEEPRLFAQTQDGFFCYCAGEEKAKREALLREFQEQGEAGQPDWSDSAGDGGALDFEFMENDGPEPEEKPEPPAPPEPEKAEAAPPPPRDYAVDHELFSVEAPKPMKYTVAAKGIDCGTVVGPAVAPGVQRAAKRIVVSEQESYLYFGKVIDGLRQGRGRTQMQSGCTAYEGGYLDDRRSGFGVYYYKSGRLCYAGNWKRNQRDGLGVAFRSADDSIFVGKWKNNIPTGQGTAFDADGNLLYSGEWKNGKRHGRGTEYQDGKIVFSGEFFEDRRISEKTEAEPTDASAD
ncbi:MAG: hypothetical protein GX424_10935 [Clostridiales bacterium]|nr:hypothetical protein [Clostridiales bacterium]